MLSEREKSIISALIDKKEDPISAKELSRMCNKNVRTIQIDLKNIKKIVEKNGAVLLFSRSHGYHLSIVNQPLFDSFYQAEIKANYQGIGSQKGRIIYILNRLLDMNSYVKTDDLTDELYLSKSTLNHVMKSVKEILSEYSLSISYKPYYGITVEGLEKDKRRCIINEIIAAHNFVSGDKDKLFDRVYNITLNCFVKMQYKIDDIALKNLLMHIYINMKRMLKGLYITFDELENDEFFSVFSHEIKMAKEIYGELAKEFAFDVIDDEVFSLAIYIKGKRNFENEDVITEGMDAAISDMLVYIKEKSNIDVSYDVELRVALALHFLPLYIRLSNDMQLCNSFSMELKQHFPLAYELAALSNAFINERYGYTLNETELGYLTIHYNLSLERENYSSKPKRILILCSSRVSNSLLLKYTLKKWFEDLILQIDVLNLYQIEDSKLNDYDVIFTTVEGDERVPKKAIKINYFLDENDYLNIQHALQEKSQGHLTSFFDPRLFLPHLHASTKEEVIECMSDLAVQYRHVSDNLCDSVFKREEYGYTSYGNLIAIPHPNELISHETFVVAAILDDPVPWGEHNAQLIFLICVDKENSIDLKTLFHGISKLLIDPEMINKIIQLHDYEFMLNCLEKMIN